jgi:beta-galactosidase
VFVAAGYYVADDAVLEWLLAYAAAGGHLIIGPRTGYADSEARARAEVAPGGGLSEAAGAFYDEYSNLDSPLPVRATPGSPLDLPPGAAALQWIENYQATTGTVLASYDHPFHGGYAAVTTRDHGAGRVITAGLIPNPQLGAALLGWAGGAPQWRTPPGVRVHSAVNARGERLWVVQNWSWEPAAVTVPLTGEDLHTGDPIERDDLLELGSWDVRVLVTAP